MSSNTIELKEFRSLVGKIGREYEGGKYNEVAQAIINKLNNTFNPNKEEQQNILNSCDTDAINALIINGLDSEYDFSRHSFSKEVFSQLKSNFNMEFY